MQYKKADFLKDVVISIRGVQVDEPDNESVELVTDGCYWFNDGRARISYSESEVTGMPGTETTFNVSPGEIILSRRGTLTSDMVFREGYKDTFLYDTPYGSAMLGLDTHRISCSLDEHGGDLEIDYVINIDHSVVGRNRFKINVRECTEGE